MKPKISILTTVYNGLPYICETVESVIKQTLKDFEYVIVDDGSNDGTIEYLKSLSDPRILMILSPKVGRGVALNIGLKACRSDLVAMIDADDVNSPIRLEIQSNCMAKNPELAVLACVCPLKIDDVDLEINIDLPVVGLDYKKFIKQSPISHSGVIMRRDAVLNVGGYDEKRKQLFDYDLWLRLAKHGYLFGKMPARLVYKRLHIGQNFEARNRITYLASGFKCRMRAVCLFSRNSLYFIYPFVGFVYGLLPKFIRKRDN